SIPCPVNLTGSTESAAVELPKCAATPALSLAMPPTARTAYTARITTADILITNCTRSVHSTAHIPAATEYDSVTRKQMPTATTWPEIVRPATSTSRRPSEIVRIL